MSRYPALLLAALACGAWLVAGAPVPVSGQPGRPSQDSGKQGGHSMADMHAPVPPEYRDVKAPKGLWANQALISRGRRIHDAKCAVCHGADGSGNGPAAAGMMPKPPSLLDKKMVADMSPSYWFWRVSEGGAVEPYKSMDSAMPAWKDDLSVEDRWAVIAYQHTLSGHRGPHDPSQHPELRR